MIYTNIVVIQFFCNSAVSILHLVLVEDCNDLFFYHLILCRITSLPQMVVKRTARKFGKLQQRFQRILSTLVPELLVLSVLVYKGFMT